MPCRIGQQTKENSIPNRRRATCCDEQGGRRTYGAVSRFDPTCPAFFLPLSPRVVWQRYRRRGAPSHLPSLGRKDHYRDNALSPVHKAVGDEICRISALRPGHRAVRCRRAAGQKVLCVTCNLKHPPAACIRASTDDFCLLLFLFLLHPPQSIWTDGPILLSLSPHSHFLIFLFSFLRTLYYYG